MQSYKVLVKCRLVDLNKYLNVGTIFVPETDDYNRTSRSLAAALRAGWIQKITEEEVKSLEKKAAKREEKQEKQQPVKDDKVKMKKHIGAHDMKPEDFADEVVGKEKDIVEARDKRRSKKSETANDIKNEIKEKTKKRKSSIKKTKKVKKIKKTS